MKRKKHFPTLELEYSLWERGFEYVAGVDEAGRGPLAGPVVAAAVIFKKGDLIEGVDDSKRLSEKARELFFREIVANATTYGVGIISNDVIDRINIYKASILAMRKAVENLLIPPNFIIADGNFFVFETQPFQNIVGGDSKSFTIAAASILAKVTRDRLMREFHKLFPMYGFDRHKGYGTKKHFEALKEFGECEIHRKSFNLFGIKT
jgi:ribonuclease HII